MLISIVLYLWLLLILFFFAYTIFPMLFSLLKTFELLKSYIIF